MKGLGRNINYWFCYSFKSFLMVTAMMVGIVTVTAFMDADPLSVTAILGRSAAYIAFSTFILIMVNAFNNVSVVYPMTVSLGSTRMPSLLGMTIGQHLVSLIGFAAAVIFTIIANPDMSDLLVTFWPLVLALLFTCHAFGGLIAVLSAKFGKILGMILYFAAIIGVTVLGVYFLSSFIIGGGSVTTDIALDINAGLMVVILFAPLVLDVLFFLLLYAVVRNKNLEI